MQQFMKRLSTIPFVALIPASLILGGIIWALSSYMKLADYRETTGEIVELVCKVPDRYDADRDVLYYPKIRYYDESGLQHVFELKVGQEHPRSKEGDTINLLINKNNPDQVIIHPFIYLWLWPTVLLVIGVAILFLVIRRMNRA